MGIIRQYSIYVYIPLIAAIIAVGIILLMRIIGFIKSFNETGPKIDSLSKGINDASNKIERISQSKDSFSFVLAVLAIFGFAKDVRKYRKKDYSVTNSIAKAAMRNSSGLKKVRL